MNELKSRCCRCPVITEGMPDFIGDDTIVTVNYFCSCCKKPCNIIECIIELEVA